MSAAYEPPSTPTKRPRTVALSSSLSPRQRKGKAALRRRDCEWNDLPDWSGKGGVCPIMQLPLEVLDHIVGDGELELRDHIALAGVSSLFRSYYTHDVWKALVPWLSRGTIQRYGVLDSNKTPHLVFQHYLDPCPTSYDAQRTHAAAACTAILAHIFTPCVPPTEEMEREAERRVDAERKLCITVGAYEGEAGRFASLWRGMIADEWVNSKTISKTEAKKRYKVSDAELASIKCIESSGDSVPSYRYIEAAVQALAYRSHGSVLGHQRHLRTLAERAAKAKATREEYVQSILAAPKSERRKSAAKNKSLYESDDEEWGPAKREKRRQEDGDYVDPELALS